MNRSILRAGFFVGAFGLGLCGCHQAESQKATVKADKPDDPTSWDDKSLPRDNSNSGTSNGLAKSSRLQGGLSDEAREIESSMGVGH